MGNHELLKVTGTERAPRLRVQGKQSDNARLQTLPVKRVRIVGKQAPVKRTRIVGIHTSPGF